MKHLLLFVLLNTFIIGAFSQEAITESELKAHVLFLTSDANAGRFPGSKANKKVVNYIEKEFKRIGLIAFDNGYKQFFKAKLRVDKGKPRKKAKTCNVIGFIEGNDPVLKNDFIVLGAHYDHLGFGGPSSKSEKRGVVYHGADDNASGTSALLEIAEKIASQKNKLKRSIIFIAFGAEEQGLLGSKFFVKNPLVSRSKLKLMINMDMVGRLNQEKHVYMGGAGTFPNGEIFMKNQGELLGLTPIIHSGSVGGSDHVSFYKNGVSVLGIHTGAHPQYHTPEDTPDLINYKGQKLVCQYVFNALFEIASTDYKLRFINQD